MILIKMIRIMCVVGNIENIIRNLIIFAFVWRLEQNQVSHLEKCLIKKIGKLSNSGCP